ncbi:MAG: hypothetical protein ACI89U_001699 [Gammaproteobacteria bacterium]|jgi:uncharacterized protein (DUF58 family)
MSQLSDRPLRIPTEPKFVHFWRLLVWILQLRLVPLWHERFNYFLVRYYRRFFYDGLTRTGKVILVCSLLIFFMNYHNSQQFNLLLAAIGLGTLICSASIGYVYRPVVTIRRKTSRIAVANTVTTSFVSVTNNSRRHLYNFTAREMAVPGGNWIPEWDRPHIASLAPGETITIAVLFTPKKRGVLALWGVAVQSYFPFFLSRHSQKTDNQFDLYILPQPLSITLPPLRKVVVTAAKKSSSGRNTGRSPHSLEYIHSRPYQSGDSLKRLDHRAGGRRGEPMSKVVEGADLIRVESVYLVIDSSMSDFKTWQPQPTSTKMLDQRLALASRRWFVSTN